MVEAHGPAVDVPGFGAAPVEVQSLQQRPAHGTQVQELQQDGHHRAGQLWAGGSDRNRPPTEPRPLIAPPPQKAPPTAIHTHL